MYNPYGWEIKKGDKEVLPNYDLLGYASILANDEERFLLSEWAKKKADLSLAQMRVELIESDIRDIEKKLDTLYRNIYI